jgi:hypothetical protein
MTNDARIRKLQQQVTKAKAAPLLSKAQAVEQCIDTLLTVIIEMSARIDILEQESQLREIGG